MAEAVLWKTLRDDESARRSAVPRRTDGAELPEYTPDFVKLAESYGAKGIRVTKNRRDLGRHLKRPKKNTKTADPD